ncbi:DUF6894 family protein [Devosia nitrariae]|uniref:DUF6894 domain-containing protein n=1 Tax=Devosia nitrariae TaxID=2071872 RepID=A0ABQ5WBW4_9HYPH|nr:hypothetical protein [Devosia nitrariae]GLQ57239.1 hypothetical protein GCM10010862_44980 [Devosia nitrariae]
MPHYFFDVENGSAFRDYVGRDLASLQAAKREADEALSAAVKNDLSRDTRRDIAINVRDEASIVVLRVALSYSATPPLPQG